MDRVWVGIFIENQTGGLINLAYFIIKQNHVRIFDTDGYFTKV